MIKVTNHYKIIDKRKQLLSDAKVSYEIVYRITNKCFFKCEYCKWCSFDHYPTNLCLKSIETLVKVLHSIGKDKLLVYFHGGEPLYHPDFKEILSYILTLKEIQYIVIATNGVMIDDDLIDLSINSRKVVFSVTFHYNELKRHNLLNVFVNNASKLYDNKLLDTLEIMCESFDKEFKSYISLFEDTFKGINITYTYAMCHYGKNKALYETYKHCFHKNPIHFQIDDKLYDHSQLFYYGLNCYGLQCDALRKIIYLEGNGDTFVCGIHMTNYIRKTNCYTKEGTNEPLCNVLTDASKLRAHLLLYSKVGYKCRWEYCGGDFEVPKYTSKSK